MGKKWEALCKKCGNCCYEKSRNAHNVLIINFSAPCPYLNEKSRLCKVYTQRFKKCRDCSKLNIFHALFNSGLPPDCGYVQKYQKWRNIFTAL